MLRLKSEHVQLGGLMDLVILVLAGVLALATGGGVVMSNVPDPVIGGIGAPPLDFHVTEIAPGGDKPVCQISRKPGGCVRHALLHAKRLGANVEPVFLVGDDDLAEVLVPMLRKEFPGAPAVAGLSESRVTFVHDGCCRTTRPRAVIEELPPDCQTQARSWPMCLIGPLSADDFRLLANMLSLPEWTLLMLSKDQLSNRQNSLRLMRAAGLTVLNHEELSSLAGGIRDPVDAILRLRDEEIGNILATTRNGAVGFIDGGWVWHPSFQVRQVVGTVGAGDHFVGTLLAARGEGESWAEAVRLGLAASAIVVEGGAMPTSLDALREFAGNRETVTFSPWPRDKTPVANRLRLALPVAYAFLGYLAGKVW